MLLPATKIKTFVDNLESYDKVLVSWRVYQVQSADTLQSLSSRYRISVAKLAEINGISARAALKKGQTLLVPRDGNGIRERTYLAYNNLLKTSVGLPASARSPRTGHLVYIVRKGDTLQAIARRYGIDINSVRSSNKGSDRLSIGQKLTLKLAVPFNSPYSS